MIYLIFGEDTFRSQEKLTAIKEKYRQISGDFNLIELNGENLSWEYLQNQISASPFLANKRLVVVKFISKADSVLKDKLTQYLEKVPSSTVLFFYETKLDMRVGLFKKLTANKKNCEEFTPLEGLDLKKWIQKRFTSNNLEIDRSAIERFSELTGNDLWQTDNEIEKLTAYKFAQKNNKVALADVELLVHALPQANIFHLIDGLHSRNLKQSLSVLEQLTKTGEDEFKILGLIISQLRNLAIVQDLKLKNPTWNNSLIAKKSGLKPFVVNKLASQTNKLDKKWVADTYQRLADIDWQIKTGRIEPHLGLNLLVSKVCGNFNNS